MNTLTNEQAFATKVKIEAEKLNISLKDGREISIPLDWFPKLINASQQERNNFRLIGQGIGIHWPDLDEDLSIAGLLKGKSNS